MIVLCFLKTHFFQASNPKKKHFLNIRPFHSFLFFLFLLFIQWFSTVSRLSGVLCVFFPPWTSSLPALGASTVGCSRLTELAADWSECSGNWATLDTRCRGNSPDLVLSSCFRHWGKTKKQKTLLWICSVLSLRLSSNTGSVQP